MKRVFLICVLFLCTYQLLSQTLPPPGDYPIISDYGPRYYPDHYDWHGGIDYDGEIWDPVNAVEGGGIVAIAGGAGLKYIRIESRPDRFWTYIHIFTDFANSVSPDERYEYINATLVDSATQETEQRNIIIFWVNKNLMRAEKVLVFRDQAGWWVQYGENYILDQNGNRIHAQGSVTQGEIIAPMGTSGGVGSHLHLSCASHFGLPYDINPLYYVIHDAPDYPLTWLEPEEEFIFYRLPGARPVDQTHERVRVYLNSEDGMDLDKAKICFFERGTTPIFDAAHRADRIVYGGLPPDGAETDAIPAYITNDGDQYKGSYSQTGISPRSTVTCGLDTMYFVAFNTKINKEENADARINSEAKFPDGKFDLICQTTSITHPEGNFITFKSSDLSVSIDNFVPYVQRVRIEQVLKSNSVVKYEAHWPTIPLSNTDLGELIIDTDLFCIAGLGVTFTIEFSENMNTAIIPVLQVEFPDGGIKTVTGIFSWLNDTTYQIITGNDFISSGTSGRATLWISGAYDLAGNQNDGDPRTIACRNPSNPDEWLRFDDPPDKNYQFWIEAPPQVVSTDPADGAADVDVYKNITITFNKKMNPETVNSGTILFSPALQGSFTTEWGPEGKIVVLTMTNPKDLKFSTNYTMTVTDGVKDIDGTQLDGDKDGEPGGDYLFSFTTRPPEFSLGPESGVLQFTKIGQIKSQEFTISSQEQREITMTTDVNINGGAGAWVTTWFPYEVYLDPQGSQPLTVNIQNVAEMPKSCIAQVDANWDSGLRDVITKSAELICSRKDKADEGDDGGEGEGTPGGDHPDENYSVHFPQYPTEWYIDAHSKVGILYRGFGSGMGHLLGRFKIPTCVVRSNLKILGLPERDLNDLSVLIIGSAGLKGLEGNTFFQQKIEEFVNNGGILICMTQPYGEQFEILPGDITGYGWREDQSCWQGAGYFSDWDVILSGQDTVIIDTHIDGFFINVPDDSKVFMKRRTTAMPEMFYYDYGQGKVLVCGLYSDWGYGQAQWSNDEVNLIRDVVTWALDAKRPIQEYYTGNAMTLDIPVHYYPVEDTTPANKVKIKIQNPNRDSIYLTEIPLSPPLYPEDSTIVNFTGYNVPSTLGIYPVNYSLYNDTFLLQEEKLGERFAVKTDIPVGEYYLGDFGI